MKKKIGFVLFSLFCLFLVFACDNFNFSINFDISDWLEENSSSGEIPEDIKDRVVYYARKYEEADTYYKYGGQDPLRAIGIDCSGLVVMCYKYALEGTGYTLIKSDMNTTYMKDYASDVTYNPEPGDLVFMGDANSSKINHVGIFVKKIGSEVYFIDSSSSGSTGVYERHYSEFDKKIKSYGVMKLKRK